MGDGQSQLGEPVHLRAREPAPPPVHQQATVGGDVGVPARGPPLEVRHPGPRLHEEATAVRLGGSQAVVDVLHAVDEHRVEAAKRRELGCSHSHRCCGDGRERSLGQPLRILRGVPGQQVDGQEAGVAEDGAGGLHGVVGEQQQRLYAAHRRILQVRQHRLQPAAANHGVVVQEHHRASRRLGEADVAADGEVEVVREPAVVHGGLGQEPGDQLTAHLGGRAVVDEDDLDTT
jgi:hypothetical protein